MTQEKQNIMIDERFSFSLPLYQEPSQRLKELLSEDDQRSFSFVMQYIQVEHKNEPDRLNFLPIDYSGILSNEERKERISAPIVKGRYSVGELKQFVTLFNNSNLFAENRIVKLIKPTPEQNSLGIQKVITVDFFDLGMADKLSLNNLFELVKSSIVE